MTCCDKNYGKSSEKRVKEKYKNSEEKEDKRLTRSRYSGLEFHYSKKHVSEYINKDSSGLTMGYYNYKRRYIWRQLVLDKWIKEQKSRLTGKEKNLLILHQ